ncbi:hypothetical protein OFC53_39705, partial [Escherichia coli]|nr:hypothetical protein [Escherichia coli]
LESVSSRQSPQTDWHFEHFNFDTVFASKASICLGADEAKPAPPLIISKSCKANPAAPLGRIIGRTA